MSDAPDKQPTPRKHGVLESLRAAGAEMDGFDDATLEATEAVHRALLAQPKTAYLDLVDPANWNRLPVALETLRGEWPGRIEQLCLVVPWAPAVMPSAVDYLRAVGQALRRSGHKTVLLVTSQELTEREVDQLGRETGYLVTALLAPDLKLVGPERARERIPDVIGKLSSADNVRVDVGAAIVAHNTELRKADRFHDVLEATTPRVWAAPFILGVNALVFAAMAASGAGWWMPSADSVFAWGGTYGPNVVHGEWWRLLTANYVHFGILHIGFNMWCFWQVGRFTERLLGSWAFLVAYTLSGVGGAIASIGHNPLGVGAGASGAVFGVFGCILGFMLVRRRTVPVLVFKPLVLSLLGFLGYNLAYGLTQPHIDNSAHVGGLVVGFLCGIALSRRLPMPKGGTPPVRYLYVFGVALLVALGGAFAAHRVPKDAPPWMQGKVSAVTAYEEFARAVAPLLDEHKRIAGDSGDLVDSEDLLESRDRTVEDAASGIAQLVNRARENIAALDGVAVRHREVAVLKFLLRAVLIEQAQALEAIRQAFRAETPAEAQAHIRSWHLYTNTMKADIKRFESARAQFFKLHGLKRRQAP